MPRKSLAALSLPDVTGTRRLSAPAGLSKAAKLIFDELVSANSPEHFVRSDLPLLVEYSAACALARQAGQHLDKDGAIIDGKASPWLTVQEKATRTMTALSMRLRLSPQSRLDQRGAGRSANKPGPRGIDVLFGGGDD